MTPQQLIDLPYAGMAERELRKMGWWALTKDERMKNMKDTIYRMDGALREIENMAGGAQQ